MDVLEALEDETLESHSRGPGFESLCAHKIKWADKAHFILWSLSANIMCTHDNEIRASFFFDIPILYNAVTHKSCLSDNKKAQSVTPRV